jgi:hypothetical protein
MSEKLQTIDEIIAGARQSAMNPRVERRHLTCATCGQIYDKTDLAQASHHASAAHAKWAP